GGLAVVQDEEVETEVGDELRDEGGRDELVERSPRHSEQQGAAHDEDQRDVHDRIGQDDQLAESGERRVVDVRVHQEVPEEGQGTQCDDGGIGVVLSPVRAVVAAGEPQHTCEEEGVSGQVESVADRWERYGFVEGEEVVVVDVVTQGEAQPAECQEVPGQSVAGAVHSDADQDAHHRGGSDRRVEGVLPGGTGEGEVPRDGGHAAGQGVLPPVRLQVHSATPHCSLPSYRPRLAPG